ncbi:MAG: PQQ-binding-like beta-propeller repeat protein [Vicinamibacteria bacterium]
MDDRPLVIISSAGVENWRGLPRDPMMRPIYAWRDWLVRWTVEKQITLTDPFDVKDEAQYEISPGVVCGDVLVASATFVSGVIEGNEKSLGFDLIERRPRWERSIVWRGVGGLLGPTDWTRDLFLARDEKSFAMFSKADGEELWRKRLFTGGRLRSTGDRVIVLARRLEDTDAGLSDCKYLMAFDSRSGEAIYERELREPEEDFAPGWASYPVVGKEHVVFAERSGLIGAFRMSDGALAWSHKYKAELYEPCIVGNSVAVASTDGNLLMFDDVLPVL